LLVPCGRQTILLLSTAKAVYVILNKPVEPPEKLMEDLSHNAFGSADKDGDKRITREEFVAWVKKQVNRPQKDTPCIRRDRAAQMVTDTSLCRYVPHKVQGSDRPTLDDVFAAFQLFMAEGEAKQPPHDEATPAAQPAPTTEITAEQPTEAKHDKAEQPAPHAQAEGEL
jgi:hypothetical protein